MVLKILMGVIQHDMTLNCVCITPRTLLLGNCSVKMTKSVC